MKVSSFLNYFLCIALATVIIGLIYATVQQSYRAAANDPQIQMAEDIKSKIESGKPVEEILRGDTIDIAHSLSPFAALYNASGNPQYATGYINGRMAQPPPDIFTGAKNNGEYTVTWQPQADVRIAMVMAYVKSSPISFVAAGRSLREVENREYNLRKMAFIAWVICLAIILLSAAINNFRNKF